MSASSTPRDFLIPAKILSNTTITLSARLVLAEIINLHKVKGQVWASDDYLAGRCFIGKRTVGAALKELEAAGLINRATQQRAKQKRILTLKSQEDSHQALSGQSQFQAQDVQEPTAKPATTLLQNQQEPIADFAEINTNLTNKGKTNHTLGGQHDLETEPSIPQHRKQTQTSHQDGMDSPSFEAFWEGYDKKVEKSRCEQQWDKLSQADHQAILGHIPLYVSSTPEVRFRKNPFTYLTSFMWRDEDWTTLQPPSSPSPSSSPSTTDYSLLERVRQQQNMTVR